MRRAATGAERLWEPAVIRPSDGARSTGQDFPADRRAGSPAEPRPEGTWVTLAGTLVMLLAVTVGCGGPGARTATAEPAARGGVPAPPPLLEDDTGVVGGPIDDTRFAFEPTRSAPNASLIVEGAAGVPDDIVAGLAPYLDVRRAQLATIGAEGAPMVVMARYGEVTQAYRIADAGADPLRLTSNDEPLVQVGLVGAGDIIYRSDLGGNEDYQIFRSPPSGPARLLTDGRSRHGAFAYSGALRRLAYTSNARRESDLDVYLTDDQGRGGTRPLMEREGVWLVLSFSPDGSQLLLRHYLSFSESHIYIADVATASARPLALPASEQSYVRARFSPDGSRIYVAAHREGDFVRLHELEIATGAWRTLGDDYSWDVEEIAVSGDGASLAFTTNEDGASVLRTLDLSGGRSRVIHGLPKGVITGLRFAGLSQILAFTLETPTMPSEGCTYDLQRHRLTRWTNSIGASLEDAQFTEPTVIHFESFDEQQIPAWYYRPRGRGPFPVLIWVHGGPEEQARATFNPIIQYLVRDQHIAVVAPNIRGSDGYGVRYLGLDDGGRRDDAIRDVEALVDWIGQRRELDEDRIGIHGASYGGYVVLASLLRLGTRIRAGSDMVGIANFVTFLANTRNYRADQRRAEYGDERIPEVREQLAALSPISHASELKSALLVAHGANDPRVPASEAEQIVSAARASGQEVWYLLAPDEGHGFLKRANRDAFYQTMCTFFARHLLDRVLAEPSPEDSPEPEEGDAPDGARAPRGEEARPNERSASPEA